jgi:hypothetical protein
MTQNQSLHRAPGARPARAHVAETQQRRTELGVESM